MQRFAYAFAVAVAFLGAVTLGCGSSNSTTTAGGGTPAGEGGTHEEGGEDHDHAHDHAHEHAEHGPHGGHLVELGGGKYHAEWTHDDPADQENAKNVTVYILGEDAKTEAPIDAPTVTINVSGGKEPKQYQLAPVNAADGKASQFALADPSLVVDLGMVGDAVKANLDVKIDGAAYNGLLEHAHDHEHEHAH